MLLLKRPEDILGDFVYNPACKNEKHTKWLLSCLPTSYEPFHWKKTKSTEGRNNKDYLSLKWVFPLKLCSRFLRSLSCKVTFLIFKGQIAGFGLERRFIDFRWLRDQEKIAQCQSSFASCWYFDCKYHNIFFFSRALSKREVNLSIGNSDRSDGLLSTGTPPSRWLERWRLRLSAANFCFE